MKKNKMKIIEMGCKNYPMVKEITCKLCGQRNHSRGGTTYGRAEF